MKILWILYFIAGAPVSQGEFFTREACAKALELAKAQTFGTTKANFVCSPYLASSDEGQP